MPGFSALRSDSIHSWSGIFSHGATHASGGIIIFVRQGLSFSELCTSSLTSLDPYSDYVEVNISLNDFSSSFVESSTLRSLIRSFAFLVHCHRPRKSCLSYVKKHLPCSGMNFLRHIFDLSCTLHSFPSIIPIHKMGTPFDSPASFQPIISLCSCVLKLFERIILSRLFCFLESNSILFPRQMVSALDGLL